MPKEMSPELVTAYLNANPGFLESYILSNVSSDHLDKLLCRRSQIEKQITGKNVEQGVQTMEISGTSPTKKDIFAKWKTSVREDKRKMLQELTTNIHDDPNKSHILCELTACVASAVNADGFNLYLLDENKESIFYLKPNSNNNLKSLVRPIGTGTTVAAYVAHTNETVRLKEVLGDDRFPEGIIVDGATAQSVLAQPILNSNGDCVGVIELFRKLGKPPFTLEDEEVVTSLILWNLMAEKYFEMYNIMMKQRKLNEFLLTVAKSIFQDIVSMDTLIMKIMNFAKRLVYADRASLFLVDKLTQELYARIFDTGKTDESHMPNSEREIRFPMDKGVAGHVASTGEILNIPDAYADQRFNRDVDLQTGYTTRTILCMPIYIRGNIIGVVQMVNKLNGTFSKSDEESFETFAVYCGLALHHAKLYDKIRRSEQKYKVALEVLSYHSCCSEQELTTLRALDVKKSPHYDNFTRYDFSPWAIDNDEKPLFVIHMFKELLDSSRYRIDDETLMKFTLTIRKNYRNVPYHNWAHAFSVAHAMFTVVKTTKNDFSPLECLVLFVSCLCHDLDHRGKTNSFMVKSASPLAAIYSTSTMEHHHFNQTVSILQQDGHNIFRHFSPQEYKMALGKIRECILATDLALFFGNRAKLKELVDKKEFKPDTFSHREMLMFHCMTAADLCSMYKPWVLQVKLVNIIMEEFWQQGDEEKSQGIQPIAMMDRAKAHQLPQSQVGFILGICLPCYELMAEVLPGSSPMAEGASANLKRWKELADAQAEKEEDAAAEKS